MLERTVEESREIGADTRASLGCVRHRLGKGKILLSEVEIIDLYSIKKFFWPTKYLSKL